ncbi:hypothetical protein N7510_008740 [Penicillium lagena]|uniref:uncharacterized protein n=1 Tax=Penicillium lagena TaxID=94218 RepID=UPI00254007B5|nr:uncharacterized protein N7510_008740 [Penicillium lagena]KAJ5605959.1 hypothetical protein N7510_008740 [Penicillium lagena]
MDPPTSAPRTASAQQPPARSSHASPTSPPERPLLSCTPPPTDNKTGPDPMAGRDQRPGPVTTSETTPTHETRLEAPTTVGETGKSTKASKRKKNRQRKRRNRRQSFLVPANEESHDRPGTASGAGDGNQMESDRPTSRENPRYYKFGSNLSTTSLESDALLDHRDQPMMRPRRESRLAQSFRPGPLLSNAFRSGNRNNPGGDRNQRNADGDIWIVESFASGQPPPNISPDAERDYDVNNPPSIPGTPKLGGDLNYDDAVVTGVDFDFSLGLSLDNRRDSFGRLRDTLIDIEGSHAPSQYSEPSSPRSPRLSQELRRRRTVALPVEEDVCFPNEEVSELGDEGPRMQRDEASERRRRRHRQWPDLSVLQEWSREEKEDRNGDIRVKKISEPMLVEGRLRPQYQLWRREEDEAPYRFTYFNEEFQSTIHAQTISELVQPGCGFQELFIPDPPELEESSDDEDMDGSHYGADGHFADSGGRGLGSHHADNPPNGGVAPPNRASQDTSPGAASKGNPRLSVISEGVSQNRGVSPSHSEVPSKPKRYGPRPTFWLDVLSPTDAEMRVIAKAFGIHALTAEDIMMQEAREKVELFRSYYFVNYRTFEQDTNSENYLEPVNMYVVVFREGVLSFHFSQTPHPANVRRRIRQLMDYLILSSDWISYALIDDITDVFGPLIQAIEDEVDEIDDSIMQMHPSTTEASSHQMAPPMEPSEMLRRYGDCRKKVMGLYRLLSNKADVVKGFAKRCNEQWEVAPKSEIGLYLGDIQDHILTMTSNLSHYETILSRAHSNYLTQINILMNERQEKTADVLGKLTVLGTIVLPMNIICGMWGMNVKVPGQEIDNLNWFWCIVAGLVVFAFVSFLIAKRVYKIV